MHIQCGRGGLGRGHKGKMGGILVCAGIGVEVGPTAASLAQLCWPPGHGTPARLVSRCAFSCGPSWTMDSFYPGALGTGDFGREKVYYGQAQEVDKTLRRLHVLLQPFLQSPENPPWEAE